MYTTHPWADFHGRYLHSWNSVCQNGRRWKHLTKTLTKTHRSVLAPSGLSSNRAWKTAPGVCDIHHRVYGNYGFIATCIQMTICNDRACLVPFTELRWRHLNMSRIFVLDTSWSQLPPLLPPGTCPHVFGAYVQQSRCLPIFEACAQGCMHSAYYLCKAKYCHEKCERRNGEPIRPFEL